MRVTLCARFGLFVVAACALPGCGSTSQSATSFGAPVISGGTPVNRLDFVVDNNQTTSGDNLTGGANIKPGNVKSFILVQAQNTTNPTFSFQFTDYNHDANLNPIFGAPYLQIPSTPPFYTIPAPGTAGTGANGVPPRTRQHPEAIWRL